MKKQTSRPTWHLIVLQILTRQLYIKMYAGINIHAHKVILYTCRAVFTIN